MPTYPRGPQLLKGALVSVDPKEPPPRVIAFQFNPETLTRSLQPQTVGGEPGERASGIRFVGAPVETLSVEIEIDSTADLIQLEDSGAEEALGHVGSIYPKLAALELLIFPKSSQVVSNTTLLNAGTIEIIPYSAPTTLFVWGPKRVVPVRVNSFSITEQAFDTNLTPIRASVSLNMRVLTYSDLGSGTREYNQYLVYQQTLEAMAKTALTGSPESVIGVDIT
jgi:hypothetical protein